MKRCVLFWVCSECDVGALRMLSRRSLQYLFGYLTQAERQGGARLLLMSADSWWVQWWRSCYCRCFVTVTGRCHFIRIQERLRVSERSCAASRAVSWSVWRTCVFLETLLDSESLAVSVTALLIRTFQPNPTPVFLWWCELSWLLYSRSSISQKTFHATATQVKRVSARPPHSAIYG